MTRRLLPLVCLLSCQGSANREPLRESYALDFGQVGIGAQATQTVTLSNGGGTAVGIVSIAPSDPAYALDVPTGTVIPANGVLVAAVTFNPATVGAQSGSIVVTMNSELRPTITLQLSGEGVALGLGVDPQSVDFGNVVVRTSVTRAITLRNDSAIDLPVTVSGVEGISRTLFTVIPSGNLVLKVGDTAQILVTYAPLVPSVSDDAYFLLEYGPGNSTQVSVHGVGVQSGLQVTPNPADFNFIQLGSQRTLSVHIVNQGNQQVSLASIAVTESDGAFALAAGAQVSATLGEGESLDVPVVFSPKQARSYRGGLEISSNDNLGQQVVLLKGYGGGAAISCTPSVLDFQAVAGIATTLPLICTNSGTDVLVSGQLDPAAELDIANLEITGGNGTFQAAINPTSPLLPIAAGQSIQVDVTFTPSGVESDFATLTVQSNVTTPPAPVVVPLSGEGILESKCSYTLTPTSLNWGRVQPGSSTQSFTITNIGTNECLVSSVNLIAGSDDVFSVAPIASQRLSPLGPAPAFPTSLVVPVTFAPPQAGDYAGAVGFTISDPDNPSVIVLLQGTGDTSCLHLSPNPLDFGTVGTLDGVVCATQTRTFTAINGCAQDVTIQSIRSIDPADFPLIAANVPQPVTQGTSSAPFQLIFNPPSAGNYDSTALVQTDLQAQPFALELSGRALPGNVTTDTFPGVQPILALRGQPDPDTIKVALDGAPLPSAGANSALNWSYDGPSNSISVNLTNVALTAQSTLTVTYSLVCP